VWGICGEKLTIITQNNLKIYEMAKRFKTRYKNVIYLETTTNNKPDKVYYIRYRENGKLREVKVGKYSEGIRENYCNQKLLETVNAIRLGEQPPIINATHKRKIVTFDEIVTKYFKTKELHNKTNDQTKSRYESQLQLYIGSKDIYSITKNNILAIQTEMAKTRAPKTVNQYIQFIKAVYNYALAEDLFSGVNPVKGIKEQKIDNKRERFLAIDEIKALIEEVKENEDLHLFTLLSLSTGGRLGTIMAIAKKDLDFNNNMITLNDIKNEDTYGGFFDNTLKEILTKRIANLKPNDKLIAMNERTLRRQLSKVLTKLFNVGIDADDRKNRVVIHTLRHTFASQLAIKGTPIFTIQKLLNHKDIKQTLRYAKLAPDSGKEMVHELMGSFL
jgi:site-specific recombinase XerD